MDLHQAMVHPNINQEIRNLAVIAAIVTNHVFV
jgi:hypothetical protein